MALTTYFVDLTTAKLTADVLTGATSLELDDVSFLLDTYTVKIGAETYDIDTIVGNTVNLLSATTADYIIGDVVSVDDTALDGLTPATAKRTVQIPGVDINNKTEIWLRRNVPLDMTTNITLTYSDITVWPESDKYGYDVRPQEGIDAGWDDDVDNSAIHFNSFYIGAHGPGDNEAELNNFKLMDTDTTNAPAIYQKGNYFKIRNSEIMHNRGTDHNVSQFIRMQKGNTTTIDFVNCEIHNPSSVIVGVYNNDDFNWGRSVNFDNCYIVGVAIARMYCTNDYIYQNRLEIEIKDSILELTGNFLAYGSNRGYFNSAYIIRILNSKVNAYRLIANVTTDTYYGMTPYRITIQDSDIDTVAELVYFYHRNYVGHESNSYETNSIINSTIKCSKMFYMYRPDRTTWRLYSPIIIKGCTISCSSWMFFFQNGANFNKLIFLNNKVLDCGSFFYSNLSHNGISSVELDGVLIKGRLLEEADNFTIKLKDTIVTGELFYGASNSHTLEAFNCQFKSVPYLRYSDFNMESCKIGPNGSTSVLDYGTGIFKDCDIDSDGLAIGDSNESNYIFDNCNINADIYNIKKLKLFNSIVKNKNEPYLSNQLGAISKVSPMFRIGGAEGSVEMYQCDGEEGEFKVYDISRDLIVDTTKIVMYGLTSGVLSDLDDESNILKASYRDTNNAVQYVDVVVELDGVSQWDGITPDLTRIRFIADMGQVLDMNPDNPTVTFRLAFRKDPIIKFFLDMDIKAEA